MPSSLLCLAHLRGFDWWRAFDKGFKKKKQTNKALPATRKEAEITAAITGGFTDEPKTFDSFHPMIHSALNDAAHVIYEKQPIVSLILFKRDTQQKESHFCSIKRPLIKFLDVESGRLFEVWRLIE